MAVQQFTGDLLADLRRDMEHKRDLAEALTELVERCQSEGIPFSVVGALAMREHGYVRFTEDIDIVTTREGLDRIHERLIGRGLVPRGPGLRKKLRDSVHGVNIDVITAGEHAGAGDSPVTYPPPDDAAYGLVKGRVRFATLPALISFKLTSGVWGKRPKDLVDVQELIKANHLDAAYAQNLIDPLRSKFHELLKAASEERELPE
jgi:hypothetical protein